MGTRKQSVRLSRFELEIMEILWDLREASVREVQDAIHERKRPAYTTVQTIFARLEEKKAVHRTRKIGNAFLFQPLVTRKSVYRRIIDELLELFGGSAEPVVAHLVETGKLTLEDLKALEQKRSSPAKESDKRGGRR
ncbi:MAG TPA: BlaI/MecI/CopY family transcriptional regulator [Thermoanaerobaculia bacterium]|nr:BlaI/MecI/CopY family transcriptional regulator [Thermoanaerobaculia bacterium]